MRRSLLLLACALGAPVASAQSTCTPEHAAMGHCTMPPAAAPAPAGHTGHTPATAPAIGTARPAHAADVLFMQMMIPHHAQALEMTALVNARTDHADLRLLAERMETAQRDEIAWMTRWLRARSQDADAHAGHLMDGMLTPAQMADLTAARGDAFVYKFCAYMMQHHEGALTMVTDLFGTPGGAQVADVYKLASEIDADQRADLIRLRALRDAVPAVPLVPVAAPAAAPHH